MNEVQYRRQLLRRPRNLPPKSVPPEGMMFDPWEDGQIVSIKYIEESAKTNIMYDTYQWKDDESYFWNKRAAKS